MMAALAILGLVALPLAVYVLWCAWRYDRGRRASVDLAERDHAHFLPGHRLPK